MLTRKTSFATMVICAIVIVQACRKFDVSSSKESKKPTFTVVEAKEWFYGSFKKSKEFYSLPSGSKGVGGRSNSSQPDSALLNRYPVWPLGESESNELFQVVELPYLANKVKLQIMDSAGLTPLQVKKIVSATLKKVLFIKNNNNQIVPRVIHIVPEYNYALANNFDISENLTYKMKRDFSGWVMTYDWSGKSLMKAQIINGKKIHLYKINGTVIQNRNAWFANKGLRANDTTNCNCCSGELENLGITLECPTTVSGDVPTNTGGNNGTQTCDDPPAEEEPECGTDVLPRADFPPDPPNVDLNPPCNENPECLCSLYGMGCEVDPTPGGGGGGNPPGVPFVYNGYTFTSQDWEAINLVNTEIANADYVYNNENNCYGTNKLGNVFFPGTIEHWLIQYDYITRYNGGLREYSIPRSSLPANINRGFADLANIISKEIFEIKPDNPGGVSQGTLEALNYVTKANIECNNGVWNLGFNYSGIILPHPNLLYNLQSSLNSNGVIVYKLVPRNTNPLPVALPQNIFDKLKQLAQRLKNNLSNADYEITSFLRQNPELITYIKNAAITAGVVIIVGTILEDIVTAGAGIADDWACFMAGYKLIRFTSAL